MILDEIVLHNFGVYRGRHSALLTPPSKHKPVVLVGGLNGGGKTTFLDAIHLGLYGKRARCSNRGTLGYDEFLRRSINRQIDPAEGAAVEVQFRQRSEGVERTYRIHRSWSTASGNMHERVEVIRDGVFDRVLTDVWPELVEEFIPVGISHLFFFDGEKIEGFADPENSTQLLSKAVHSLLGLDLVDRLTTDLIALEGRKRKSLKGDIERRQIEELETELNRLEDERFDLNAKRAARMNDLLRLQNHLKELEARFESEGGNLFENRKALENERDTIEKRLSEGEYRLREFAIGPAPLLMVRDLLETADRQDRREEESIQSQVLNQVLVERDQQILDEARSHSIPPKIIKYLEKFLSRDRSQRASRERGIPTYLSLHHETRENLRELTGPRLLPGIQKEMGQLVQSIEDLQSKLIDVERKLAAVPDEELIAPRIKEIQEARAAVEREQVRISDLSAEIERVNREKEAKRAVWVSLAEKALEKQFEHEDVERIIVHSQRVQKTMQKFRAAVVDRHVSRISRLVLDSFRNLLRKKSLITNLKIDPDRYTLELYGSDGQPLSPDRLSAGERQLLAVSMLWGLARASGRPLPAVIDTPLGRLDASHRTNLVEHYFPYASHQVLLLSTNEEINEKYYAKLKPWVGHAYNLEFDDARGVTEIKQGYFW